MSYYPAYDSVYHGSYCPSNYYEAYDPYVDYVDDAAVVFDRVMPGELTGRGVSEPGAICAAIVQELQSQVGRGSIAAGASPEDVFRELAK